MEAQKTELTKTSVEPPPLDFEKIAAVQGGNFIRHLELGGSPETRFRSWPMIKAGILSGYRLGLELGYKLGFNIRKLDTKDVQRDDKQLDLFEGS